MVRLECPSISAVLLGQTNAATVTGTGWLDLSIIGGGVSISPSTTYHVAHITDIAPTNQWRYRKTASPVSRKEISNGRRGDIASYKLVGLQLNPIDIRIS